MEENKPMVNESEWEEFRKTGLLVLINGILHAFGWAICVKVDKDGIATEAFPARVKFRGFDNNVTDESYIRIGKYLKDNADELYNETIEP